MKTSRIMIGFGLGVCFSMLHICYGEWDNYRPREASARILLYPGVAVGHAAYYFLGDYAPSFDFFAKLFYSYIIGVLVNGVCGAVVVSCCGWLVGMVFRRVTGQADENG